MDGAQIPLDAADRQAPFFPQRGDAAEHVDAQALAPQCHAVQLCWGHSAPPTRWAGPGDEDMLGDLRRNHRQLDDFPSALDPAASQVRPAIGTVLHHVLHPMGRCHVPAGKAVASLLSWAAAALAAGGPNWTCGRAFGAGRPVSPGLPVRQPAAPAVQSSPVTRQ